MLNNFKIGTRLSLGFGGLIVAAIAAFGASVLQGRDSQADTIAAGNATQERLAIVHDMQVAQLGLVSSIRNAGLQTDGALVNAEADAYRKGLATIRQAEAGFAKLALTPAEQAVLDKAIALRGQAEPVAEEAMRFTMAFAGEEAAKALTGKFAPIQARWAAELRQLADLQTERAAASTAAIVQANDQRTLGLAGLLALAALGAVALAVVITRSVTRPLRAAVALAERVALGDLSTRIDASGQDEAAQLLRALQTMTEQLATMVQAVRESGEQINQASSEISSGNLDLSTRTEHTAASLQQTSAALEALTAIVAGNAGHARSACEQAESTCRTAEQGGSAMREVVSKMQGISDSSRRIGDIIGVIDGIAFQTNILALNAAVEAARAGEQGRGFAVVASEVRSLAQRVSTAAAEVRTLIGESITRVDDGSRLVGQMGQTLQDLLGGVDQVRGVIGEIATASDEQTRSIVQVNGSVRQIESTTQQNAALVEEVAAAAQSLSGQTARLNDLVQRFRVAA